MVPGTLLLTKDFYSLFSLYGSGIHFFENSSAANLYVPCPVCSQGHIGGKVPCPPCTKAQTSKPNEPYALLLCRVIMGNFCKLLFFSLRNIIVDISNNDSAVVKTYSHDGYTEKNFHTVLGESIAYTGKEAPFRHIIAYDKDFAYPEYIVYYQRI